MLWEELAAPDFEKALKASKEVCVIPLGSMEKHGPHLPVGMDTILARVVSTEAAKLEPVVVFPDFYMGQMAGGEIYPGTISVSNKLLLDVMEELCVQIRRSGFKKIIILSMHGGNPHFLRYFIQGTVKSKKDYVTYGYEPYTKWGEHYKTMLSDGVGGKLGLNEKDLKIIDGLDKGVIDGSHASVPETSFMLSLRKDLVKIERINDEDFNPKGKLEVLTSAGVFSWLWWYGNHPNSYAGDPEGSSERIGRALTTLMVQDTAKIFSMVKEDTEGHMIQRNMFLWDA